MNYFLLIVLVNLVMGCTTKEATKQSSLDTMVVDDLGRQVLLPKKINRILPFAPSLTEIAVLLCDTSSLIARTPFCNYPTSILSKEIVNNYPPDFEKIIQLKPDLIITKDGMLTAQQLKQFEKLNLPLYIQKYENVEGIFSGILHFGELINKKEKAIQLIDSLKNQIVLDTLNDVAPTVLLMVSNESFYVYGKDSYASDILKIAGGRNVLDSVFTEPYPLLNAEYIIKLNPDILIGCSSDINNVSFFDLHPELKQLKAYQRGNYFEMDEDILSRPGPRVILAVDTLKQLIKKVKYN